MVVKRRGFTLIELMIVVSIIGILASVAIPGFQGFILKAKRAERNELMKAIVTALRGVHLANEKFPWDWGGGSSGINCWQHPPFVAGLPTSQKKDWNNPPPPPGNDWKLSGFSPHGSVYYHYDSWGWATPGGVPPGWIYVTGAGDLDGDTLANYTQWEYRLTPQGEWEAGNWWSSDPGTPPWNFWWGQDDY